MTKKRYGDLKNGDLIMFHGFRAKVHNVKVEGICDNKFYFGERVMRFNVEFLEGPYKKSAIYNMGLYGGVESLEVVLP